MEKEFKELTEKQSNVLDFIKKFGGAIMLYLVIFFGIVAICSRVNNMNQERKINIEDTLVMNY